MGTTGTIALMGSGELTSTMVEVHKMLLSRLGETATATFLDTPAGFQLNADQIGANAVEYFAKRVGWSIDIASYKSKAVEEVDAALAFQRLRNSKYILMGPGSPTYVLDQLKDSPIPTILIERIEQGACLVAASAAALTMGRYTLPVYEIYKVGQNPHWQAGLNLLQKFGMQMVVVPHWNNAEGGTHDTSRCFMGEARFALLVNTLDEPTPILGIDEHTACIIDLSNQSFRIHGLGTASYLSCDRVQIFYPGTDYPLSLLKGEEQAIAPPPLLKDPPVHQISCNHELGDDFWQRAHALEETFHQAMVVADGKGATRALLEMDRLIWTAAGEGQSPENITQCRDLFRELLVNIGTQTGCTSAGLRQRLEPVVETLLLMRQRLRNAGKWSAADAVRDALLLGGIVVEDSAAGYRWRLEHPQKEAYDQAPRDTSPSHPR